MNISVRNTLIEHYFVMHAFEKCLAMGVFSRGMSILEEIPRENEHILMQAL